MTVAAPNRSEERSLQGHSKNGFSVLDPLPLRRWLARAVCHYVNRRFFCSYTLKYCPGSGSGAEAADPFGKCPHHRGESFTGAGACAGARMKPRGFQRGCAPLACLSSFLHEEKRASGGAHAFICCASIESTQPTTKSLSVFENDQLSLAPPERKLQREPRQRRSVSFGILSPFLSAGRISSISW
jgi:hypothetical protein